MCNIDIVRLISRFIGSVAAVVCLYVVIAFAVRYYRHRHHVALFGLIGSFSAFNGTLWSGIIRVLNDRYIYCDLKLGLYAYLVGEGLGMMFATLHYILKARVLNVVPGSWTRYQKGCVALACFTPIPIVVVGIQTEVVEGPTFCQYSVPQAWVVLLAAIIMLNNILPTFAFLGPLLKVSSDMLRAGRNKEAASQASLFVHVMSPWSTSVHDSSTQESGHSSRLVSTSDPSTLSTTNVATNKELHRVNRQARLVRRAFIAMCISCATTLMLLIMILSRLCGLAFVNNLYAVESANCWLWCVFALPLPQERSSAYDQSWEEWTASIDDKKGWEWVKMQTVYWLNKLII